MHESDGRHEVERLREQVAAQQSVIDDLGRVVARLEARLDRAVGDDTTGPPGSRAATTAGDPSPAVTDPPAAGPRPDPQWDGDGGPVDPVTDRRHLLGRAAGLAAGAVAGGTAMALAQASPAAAATGSFSGSPAVTATGVSGYGVYATSDTTHAIHAANSNNADVVFAVSTGSAGRAVFGEGRSTGVFGAVTPGSFGAGVTGVAADGYGLEGRANSANARAQLFLTGLAPLPVPPTRTDFHIQGEIAFDTNNDLWLCIANGYPGTWRRVSGTNTAGALSVLPSPVRVYDSRPGFTPPGGTKAPLVGGVARSCDLKANSSGVPAGARAVLVNLVATGTTGSSGGFLAVYANGIAWPGTSNVNWSGPGQNVAVTTLTAVDANAICNLYANVATDVLVDVIGYYR